MSSYMKTLYLHKIRNFYLVNVHINASAKGMAKKPLNYEGIVLFQNIPFLLYPLCYYFIKINVTVEKPLNS